MESKSNVSRLIILDDFFSARTILVDFLDVLEDFK